METDDKEKATVKFRVFFSYDVAKQRRVHYLILINDTLFVVERKSLEERSDLVLKIQYDHVIDYKVEDDGSTGRPTVRIYKLDGSKETTNLSSSEDESLAKQLPEISSTEELSKRSSILTHQLQTQKALHQRILQSVGDQLKFGPSSEDDLPKSECLVRYGDPWKKLHNDKLVIGIPMINASTRWVVLSNDISILYFFAYVKMVLFAYAQLCMSMNPTNGRRYEQYFNIHLRIVIN